jgi:hypothetical protein
MSLSQSKLATELESMTPTMDTDDSADNFVGAWEQYFLDSTVGGATVEDGTISPALESMRAAFIASIEAGPAAIGNSIAAFWTALSGIAATVWITAPVLASVTPPPNLASITAACAAAGTANIAGSLSLVDSCESMAEAIHINNIGGIAIDTTAPTPASIPVL